MKNIKGAEVPIADALSRVSPRPAPPEGEFPVRHPPDHIESLSITDKASTDSQREIQWPSVKQTLRSDTWRVACFLREKCRKALLNFWNFCEELAIEDGLILKQERMVMPTTIRRDTFNNIQHGHLGQEKCLVRSRSVVFWPGITKDVTRLVQTFATCQAHQLKESNRSSKSYSVNHPATHGRYLAEICLSSKETNISWYVTLTASVQSLGNSSAEPPVSLSTTLNGIFDENGKPERLTTDNRLQYASPTSCRSIE